MPSTLSGSFASAAASNGADGVGRGPGRAENGFGDWSRRPNGSTQTFRRTSTATSQSMHSHLRESSAMQAGPNLPSVGTYVPPHLNASRGTIDTRYSREQLLDLYREQKEAGELSGGLDQLLVGDWTGSMANGISSARWGRREENKSEHVHGPEACWERNGSTEPLALFDMTEEEKELFLSSVNSPLKGVQPGGTRETGHKENTLGRKSSMSHSQMYGLSSPTSTRPSNRRREPSESYPFPREAIASPTGNNHDNQNDAQDYGFGQRRNDTLDEGTDQTSLGHEKTPSTASNNVFGSIRRSATNPISAGLNGPSSPWASASNNQPMSPMGAFGNLGLGSGKRPDIGPSRESRFRDLLPKQSLTEESDEGHGLAGMSRKPQEKSQDQERTLGSMSSREGFGHGSAALGGLHDDSPQSRGGFAGLGQQLRKQTIDEPRLGSYAQRALTGSRGGFDQQQTFSGDEHHDSANPSSPTFTNPYASPQQPQRAEHNRNEDSEDHDNSNTHIPGLGGVRQEPHRDPFSNRAAGFDKVSSFGMSGGQPFGAGNNRGFPSLGGIGSLPGLGGPADPWAAPRSRTGTPTRERSGFGDYTEQSTRSPATTFQSPSIGGPFAGAFGPNAAHPKPSRLGSLLPNAMQDHSRDDQQRQYEGSEGYDDHGRPGASIRDTDSHGRSKFDEYLGRSERLREDQNYDERDMTAPLHAFHAAPGHPLSHQSSFQQQPSQRSMSIGSSAQNQASTVQQKTMVMPDRIRWIYRDPQGSVQGPWSGLEMHDWYRAGFFSPELLVKKYEDTDYEPLAQLIRRIGNSREPFLVPQIGIPHESSTQGSSPWPNPSTVASPPTVGSSTQPPFAGSFPSFGTTLTADQQNALERRKQEEQTLMARQKEFLAYQQVSARTGAGMHGYPQQLNHHSSAQSLNSQPSYGSITSPGGFTATSPQAIGASGSSGRFDNAFALGTRGSIGPIGSNIDNLGKINEEDSSSLFERMHLGSRQPASHLRTGTRPDYEIDTSHEERTYQMLEDRARLQREQQDDALMQRGRDDQHPFSNDRLQEFRNLQTHQAAEDVHDNSESYVTRQLGKTKQESIQAAYDATASGPSSRQHHQDFEGPQTPQKSLSLTEQVQKAASAKQSPAASAWPRVPESIPPQSSSPLPAPAARRGGPSLAESLAAESIPQSQSPSMSVETPTNASSLAPWAREQQESHKQPSLKEIQDAEAKRAAKQEQILAAARRQALERESLNKPPAPAPGLPLNSTWGSTDSPTTPSAATASAWAKSIAPKAAVAPTQVKKTLQQIQQEEEAAAKRRKAQAASNATMAGQIIGAAQAMSAGGKRYADLAGKVATPSPPMTGAWTTVGASGKTKTPAATPAAPTVASASAKVASASATVANPASKSTKTASAASKTSLANAQEEFKKWAVAELRPDLNKSIVVDDFVSSLLSFPADMDIITEVVHQNSRTMDSRHFAEEFVRRRALADKGKVDTPAPIGHAAESKNASGWSEVARKGSTPSAAKQEDAAFKIVPSKKKAGKKGGA